MLRMTLHGVEVTADSPDEAVGLLHAWANDGQIEIPPAVTIAQISEAVKKLETQAIPLVEMEALNQLFLDRIRGLFTTGTGELRSTHVPATKAPATKTASASSPRPPRERRCRKCPRVFADKTCAKDCPACRAPQEKARKKKAAVPAVPAKTTAPAKSSATVPARSSAQKRTPDVAAAKGLLGRAPIKPNEATKACSSCGDKTRVSELDRSGRCRDCQPIGEPA